MELLKSPSPRVIAYAASDASIRAALDANERERDIVRQITKIALPRQERIGKEQK